MKKIVKKNYKILIGIVIGIIVSTTIVYSAENILTGNDVTYSNRSSSADNVQKAIDELYEKSNKSKAPKPNNTNIVAVYYYDETKGSEDFCVTGDEGTCKYDTCYLNKDKDSCPPGTIIEYMVSSDTKVRFHVVHDDGENITLQSQQNTLNSIQWYTENNHSYGPETALNALEEKTNNWTNVNTFDYSIGDDKSTLGYSGCAAYNYCMEKTYSLHKESVQARMLTVQETNKIGCENNFKSCPIWMYNYLNGSTSYGGTDNDLLDYRYWIMSAFSPNLVSAWAISNSGKINYDDSTRSYGIRAVVEINK